MSLRIADRIRIVRRPRDYGTMRREIRRVYDRLLARKHSLRVYGWSGGKPWVQFQLRDKAGRIHYHSFAVINDGSWVKVKVRGQL
jgi:hypothetical protein